MTRSTNMEHVEALERLRGVLEHGKMGDKCLIAPDLVTAAIAALSAPQPPAEARAVDERDVCIRCGDKPESADYNDPLTLRGLIEYVRVAANPNQGAMRWHALNLLKQALPHLQRLEAITAPPSAPVGVEGLVSRWRDKSRRLRQYHDCDALSDELEGCAQELEAALAQQPAADDVDAEQFRKGWQAGFAEGRRDQQPAAVDGAMVERALQAEVERLTGCLATANANHETFERRWYLEQDRAERLAEALRGLVAYVRETSHHNAPAAAAARAALRDHDKEEK